MSKNFCHARINFVNKEDPSYRPTYGKILTEKQMLILNGTIPLEEVRPNEVTILLRKAEVIGDERILEDAQMLYERKHHPKEYWPAYTVKEAMEVLQSLTPWPTDYY